MTEERPTIFDYSDVMYYDEMMLVVIKGKEFPFDQLEDLQGKRMAVLRGASFGDDCARGLAEKIFVPVETNSPRQGFHMMRATLKADIEAQAQYERAIHQEKLHSLQESERAESERERARVLSETNQQLESFSYSISHDLRAPLRAIDGFSRMLVEDHAEELSTEARSHLERVCAAAQRMGELIDDLLTFSRLSRQDFKNRDVFPDQLARQAWEEVASHFPGRTLECEIAVLPPAQGDATLLMQVFVNLLSNACKYTDHEVPTRIEVGWSGKAYFVKDNGIGFDMEHAANIFGVFQRLHRAHEFEGTGVGLAIVQRIVERHGGRTWTEAEPGQGATFFFTLGQSAATQRSK